MVQKLSYTANSITLGTGTSKVVLGADSGNLIVKDSQANTSILEPGLGVQGASAVTTYANPAALPFSPISSAGSLAYTTSTGALYMSNGSGWYKITLVNTAPSITLSSTTASPTATNLTLDFTYTVAEPEGTPVTVTLANSGIATTGNVAVTHTTSNTHVRLVFDGTTKYSGDASVTLTVTDGVNTGTGTITITTSYYDGTDTRQNLILMKASGTGNNDTYDDASASNHTVTKNGTVDQLSFSPYRENGYSLTVDGSPDYLNIAGSSSLYTALDLGTADYTVEFWMYPKLTGNAFAFGFSDSSGTDSSVAFALRLNLSGSDVTVRFQNTNDSGTLNLSLQHIGNYNYKWSHVAVTRTGGNQNMYINGLLVATQSDASAHMRTPAHSFSVGRAGDRSAFYYKGYLTDLRIVAGTAVYTGNFTPPTSPLTAISNTKLLIGGNGSTLFRDASTSALPVTDNGDISMVAYSPYDRSNTRNTATEPGSAFFSSTTNSYLSIAHSEDFNMGTGDFTLECWINAPSSSSYQGIFSSNAYSGSQVTLQLANTGVIRFVNPSSITAAGTTNIRDNVWHHIAMCRSGTTLRGFVDGKQEISTTYSSSIDWGHSDNAAVVGVVDRTTYPGQYEYTGLISNLRLVKGTAVYTSNFTPPTSALTAITNTKLLLNFTDSKVFDASLSTKQLTIVGDTVASSTQHFGENTVEFPGSSDYIKIEQQPFIAGETFTIEGWHNLDARTNYSPCLFNNYTSHTTGSLALFAGHGSSTTTQYQLSQNGVFPAFNAGTVAYNQWVHFAVQRNLSENIQVYIDGTQVGSDLGSTMALPGIGNDFYIGSAGDTISAGSIDGHLHDFRISKGLTRFPFVPLKQTLTTTNSQRSGVTVTASNVTLLTCHAASITDGSSNSTSITTNGNAAVSNFGPADGMKSVYFDGTGDYLQCTLADTLGTADWTIEYWVWHNSISGNQIHCAFNGYAPAFYRRNSSNAFAVYHNPGISGNHNANITPVTGKWYHMAYCHDDSENKMAVFANGSLVDEFAYTGNINGTTFRIGDDGTSAWMNGYISNLRIVKNTVVYSKTFTPTTSALQ